MNTYKLVYKKYGDSAVLIEWPQEISVNVLQDITNFNLKIEKINFKFIIEVNFVFNSMLIIYDDFLISYKEFEKKLKLLYNKEDKVKINKVKHWEIPVCYHQTFGIDLEKIATRNTLKINEVINIHYSTIYTVFGLGFLPGFLYLGGLPKEIHCNRLNTPRLSVPKGSVAIGANQTGIYPLSSPGGWNIIGKTPINLFDASKNEPCLISAGDKIQFKSVSLNEFEEIEQSVLNNQFNLKLLND